MFNEYYDYKKGFDDYEFVGIGGVIVCNGMSLEFVLWLVIVFYILVVILGLFLVVNFLFWLLLVGLVCMVVGYLYIGGFFFILWMFFGELFLGVFMGMFIIVIVFFI